MSDTHPPLRLFLFLLKRLGGRELAQALVHDSLLDVGRELVESGELEEKDAAALEELVQEAEEWLARD